MTDHMKKKRRGEKVRPCVRCKALVRFVKGTWTGENGPRAGFHWEDQNGDHHLCGNYMEVGVDKLAVQFRQAMERDRPLGAQ